MTYKQKLENLIKSGMYSLVQNLLRVLCCWLAGMITTADAQDLFTECGYTFTAPTTTGAIILTNGTTTYTIVSLITAYHDNDYQKSDVMKLVVFAIIDGFKNAGYILDSERTQLEELPW
ncbi:MAG: hypothetical protein M0R51_11095 [Clostridia bacterium]|jgi:hypothetical protein|nr:hypothetical protein [Clostridia bacterium]